MPRTRRPICGNNRLLRPRSDRSSKQNPAKQSALARPSSANSLRELAKRFLWPVLLLGIGFAVYSRSLKFDFILDDHRFTEDPRIQESGHIFEYFSNYVWAQSTGGPPSFYRPVFVLWFGKYINTLTNLQDSEIGKRDCGARGLRSKV